MLDFYGNVNFNANEKAGTLRVPDMGLWSTAPCGLGRVGAADGHVAVRLEDQRVVASDDLVLDRALEAPAFLVVRELRGPETLIVTVGLEHQRALGVDRIATTLGPDAEQVVEQAVGVRRSNPAPRTHSGRVEADGAVVVHEVGQRHCIGAVGAQRCDRHGRCGRETRREQGTLHRFLHL